MILETFFERFDQFAEAPNAVAKLRELVLQLAVRGKLVEQLPSDEPATKLLERIQKSKERLVKERAIRRQETDPIDCDSVPFPIPQSWVWTRLGEIGDWGSGSTPPRGNHDFYDGGISWLKSGELNDNLALAGSSETVTELAVKTGSFRRNQPGDVLFAMYGATIGKVAILAEPAVTNQAVCGCTPFEDVSNRYLFNYLVSQRSAFHEASEGGAQPNLSKVKIVAFPIPLPPLAEQKRIVAKVDELMALCDQLEAQQQERETRHAALARASLARFADAPTPANLNYLFHPSFNIHPSDLRKSILTLAVQGKLVPQDPADEPAEVLIERVKAARQALLFDRRVRQSDEVEYSLQDEADDAPPGWVGVHVNDVAIVQGGKRLPNGAVFSESPTPHVYIRVTDMKNGTISETGLRYISPEVQREIARYIINKEDLYITIAGTIGDVGCVPEPLDGHNLTENAAKIVFRGFDRQFFQLALTSEFVQAQFLEKTKQMAQPKLALKRIAGAKFYFPPLAEQKRIVAKVDQLMSLVDELESQLAASRKTAEELMEAAVAELTGGGNCKG